MNVLSIHMDAAIRRSHRAVGPCLRLPNPLVHATDLAELQISESGGVYHVSLVMQLQAPAR